MTDTTIIEIATQAMMVALKLSAPLLLTSLCIGFVISLHILGMFAFSPLVGMAADRLGGRTVALLGSAILCAATISASISCARRRMAAIVRSPRSTTGRRITATWAATATRR